MTYQSNLALPVEVMAYMYLHYRLH